MSMGKRSTRRLRNLRVEKKDSKSPLLLGEGQGEVKNMTEALRYKLNSIGRARAFRKDMTDGEQKLWSRLRGKQQEYYFRRQTPIGKHIVDFMCWKEKLIVEIDGWQHLTPKGKEHDRLRDQFLRRQGFRVLRFNSVEVLDNTDGVIEVICEYLQNPLLSPYEGDR